MLYALTTAHYQIAGDTPDFLVSAKLLGVPHAPGYPSLTILGHLFSLLPFGSTAFRIDLLATFCSAATVGVIYATSLALTKRPWAALGAATALAFTPLFWKWALQMETFPLNDLLAALLVYLLVRWHLDNQRRGFLVGAALVFGVGVTNQQTIVLVAPAIVLVLWLNRRALVARPTTILWCVLALVGGLLPYAYVPFAGAGHAVENWDNVRSFSAFVRLVLRQDYGGTASQVVASGGVGGGGTYFARLAYQCLAAGFVLGLAGLEGVWFAYKRQRWFLAFVLVTLAFTAVAFELIMGLKPTVGYELFVLQRFYLLPLVLAAPLAAYGLAGVGDWLATQLPRRGATPGRLGRYLVAGVVALASLLVVVTSYSTLNVSSDRVTDNYARDILNTLSPHTILFVTYDYADLPVIYAQSVEQVRPDVTIIVSPILAAPWYQQELRQRRQINVPANVTTLNIVRANPDRPVAFVGDPPDHSLKGLYYLYSSGLVYDLAPEATTIGIQQLVNNYASTMAKYHIPKSSSVKPISFEGEILDQYANYASFIAGQYATGGETANALIWYEKTLAIDPHNAGTIRAIQKLKDGS